MGTLSWSLVEEGSKMKFIAVACVVAVVFAEPEAKAEADAALLYGGYGYTGLGYAGLGYAGLGYAGLGYAGYGYPYAGYGYGHYLGKRSADAEPEAEADPALLYGAYGYTGLGYGGYRGLGYSANAGYPYTGYGYSAYSPYTFGHYLGKRSADAEPKAEADPALLYGAYGYTGLGYAGYAGRLGYSASAGYPYLGGYSGYGYGGYAWGK